MRSKHLRLEKLSWPAQHDSILRPKTYKGNFFLKRSIGSTIR